MEFFPMLFLCSLLIYRKATDFCKLILYPATLLKLFMVSRMCLVEFFGVFLRYKSMSFANRDSVTYSFPICILIALVRNSKTMLKRSGESGYPCLIPDFRGNVLSFPQ
jgi:hypothetical protein